MLGCTEMNDKEMECKNGGWIRVAFNIIHCWALWNVVLTLRVPQNAKIVTTRMIISFSLSLTSIK